MSLTTYSTTVYLMVAGRQLEFNLSARIQREDIMLSDKALLISTKYYNILY